MTPRDGNCLEFKENNHIRSATKEEAGRLQKLLEQDKPTLRIKEEHSL
jgi:hypothetical protein